MGIRCFLDAFEIESLIQFSSLEEETTRMVRSPKLKMLLTEYWWKIQLNSLNIHFKAFPISFSVELYSFFAQPRKTKLALQNMLSRVRSRSLKRLILRLLHQSAWIRFLPPKGRVQNGLEREAIRMVRSLKTEILFQITKSSRGFKESNDSSFLKSQDFHENFKIK